MPSSYGALKKFSDFDKQITSLKKQDGYPILTIETSDTETIRELTR